MAKFKKTINNNNIGSRNRARNRTRPRRIGKAIGYGNNNTYIGGGISDITSKLRFRVAPGPHGLCQAFANALDAYPGTNYGLD